MKVSLVLQIISTSPCDLPLRSLPSGRTFPSQTHTCPKSAPTPSQTTRQQPRRSFACSLAKVGLSPCLSAPLNLFLLADRHSCRSAETLLEYALPPSQMYRRRPRKALAYTLAKVRRSSVGQLGLLPLPLQASNSPLRRSSILDGFLLVT